MVRHRVVRLGHANLRIRPRALLAAVHERDDARDVRLIREELQVVEQTGVIVEALGDARRPRHVGNFFRALLFGLLDPPLDVTQRGEIVVHPRVVRGTELPLQLLHPVHHRVEKAAVLAQPRRPRPFGSVLSLAPNSRSNTTRGLFSVISGSVGVSHEIVLLYAQLYPTSQDPTRLLSSICSCSDESCVSLLERPGGNLVHRDAGLDDRIGLLDVHAAQVAARRARVIAAAVAQRLGQIHEQARDDDQLVLERLQAGKRRRQLEIRPDCRSAATCRK